MKKIVGDAFAVCQFCRLTVARPCRNGSEMGGEGCSIDREGDGSLVKRGYRYPVDGPMSPPVTYQSRADVLFPETPEALIACARAGTLFECTDEMCGWFEWAGRKVDLQMVQRLIASGRLAVEVPSDISTPRPWAVVVREWKVVER